MPDIAAVTNTLEDAVRQAVEAACLTELSALKPGNVHVYADGHEMTVDQFRTSAYVAAKVLGRPGLRLGERIYEAVTATNAAVGCNTNLGIVLLCAPLAEAALKDGKGADLSGRVRRVLRSLDVADADLTYQAIRLANPAGLGESARYDVREPAKVTLRVAMAEAADRDLIARQYVDDYAEVFGFGTPRVRQAMARWHSETWAATAVYLGFLSHFPDSHIRRKFGPAEAEEIRRRAIPLDQDFAKCRHPQDMEQILFSFDKELKNLGINPGTSADFTVASLLVRRLEDILGV